MRRKHSKHLAAALLTLALTASNGRAEIFQFFGELEVGAPVVLILERGPAAIETSTLAFVAGTSEGHQIGFLDLGSGAVTIHPFPCSGCANGTAKVLVSGGSLDQSGDAWVAGRTVQTASGVTTQATIWKISPDGVFTPYAVPEVATVFNTGRASTTVGDDGRIWYTAPGVAGYGALNPATGPFVRLRTPSAQAIPSGPIATGPPGPGASNSVRAQQESYVYMGLMPPGGVAIGNARDCKHYLGEWLGSIINGLEGHVWATSREGDTLLKVAPDGTFTSRDLPEGCQPRGVAFGPDGNFYIACQGTRQLCQYDGGEKLVCSDLPIIPKDVDASGTAEGVKIVIEGVNDDGKSVLLAGAVAAASGAPDLTVILKTFGEEARAGDAFLAEFSIFNQGSTSTTGPFTFVFGAPGFEIINAGHCSLSGSTATCTYSETVFPSSGTLNTIVRMAPVGVSSPTPRTLSAYVYGGGDVDFTNNFSSLIVTVLPPRNIVELIFDPLENVAGRH